MQSKQLLAAAAAAAKKAIQQHQAPNSKVSVPVDAFKAICVYEDENRAPEGLETFGEVSLDTSLNASGIRWVFIWRRLGFGFG